ncbi:hypothetical protein BOC35_15980 [Burkholderia pseudomallei]|nr:hypothetical protein BOC35_15980 [Burkholderia pseudomallei]ARL22213.1 hypothetical protein BOC47_07205 [Burkholderia pseudomallei]NRD86640.1 hypothetical protein [Burkholderia pseudomallei]
MFSGLLAFRQSSLWKIGERVPGMDRESKNICETLLRGTELMPTITPLSRYGERRGAKGEAGGFAAQAVRSAVEAAEGARR